jgi:hypothetical protein
VIIQIDEIQRRESMTSHTLKIISSAALCLTLAASAAAQDAMKPATAGQNADEGTSHWLASGFVGSNFANDAKSASTNIGGSIGYLWRNRYGAEFDLGITPSFDLQNNFFGLGLTPQVGTYMTNAIWAMPLGTDGRWQPFVSGGVGALSLRSGIDNSGGIVTDNPNDTRFGGNVGGGFMGFSGRWGFKADVRYFRATGTYNAPASTTPPTPDPNNPTPAPGPYGLTTGSMLGATNATSPAAAVAGTTDIGLATAALTGLHFWRANAGIAFRW